MTDEEKAEEYVKGKAHEHYDFLFEENSGCPADFAKLCYLDGLAEGRKEKWHDLRKNPNDLPKEGGEYWCKWNDGAYCTEHYFEVGGFCDFVIAWCELPKFEEI